MQQGSRSRFVGAIGVTLMLAAGCGGTSDAPRYWEDAGPTPGAASGSSGGSSFGQLPGPDSSTGSGSGGSVASGGSSGSSSGSAGAASSSGSGVVSSGSSGAGGDGGVTDATSVSADSAARAETGAVDSAVAGDASDPLAAARAQCVQIINQDRATLNPPSPPLQETTAREPCVDGQAKADYTANTAHSAFGVCKEFAQDECPNWPGPPSAIMTKCLAQMWAEGPPPPGVADNHWLNMSNAKYTKVACGFYQTPSGTWWATQDFW